MKCGDVITSNSILWASSLIGYFADIYSSRSDPQVGEDSSLPATSQAPSIGFEAGAASEAGPGPGLPEAPLRQRALLDACFPTVGGGLLLAPLPRDSPAAPGVSQELPRCTSQATPFLPAASPGLPQAPLRSRTALPRAETSLPAAGPAGLSTPSPHSTPSAAHSSRVIVITAEDVSDVIARVKREKTCAGNRVVSEMLQALLLDGVVRFAELLGCLLADTSLSFPTSWTELEAILLPQNRCAGDLERFQADHYLSDACEHVGLGVSCQAATIRDSKPF